MFTPTQRGLQVLRSGPHALFEAGGSGGFAQRGLRGEARRQASRVVIDDFFVLEALQQEGPMDDEDLAMLARAKPVWGARFESDSQQEFRNRLRRLFELGMIEEA